MSLASFQNRSRKWVIACFGSEAAQDLRVRRHRFVEEAIELDQALGGTADEAHALINYVYGREIGQPTQEVGGVMVTLASLCSAASICLTLEAEHGLFDCWNRIDKIRQKQKDKVDYAGPLPVAPVVELAA